MTEIGDMRGGSILRYCSTCKNNMWHKIDMCGKCGTTNTTKHKEQCRCCGGLFDSLVCDHPGLQGQCATCVENYEKEKQDVSSDQYRCAGCEKWHHELDLERDKDGNLLCADCKKYFDAGRVPKKRKQELCKDCGVEPVDPPPRCGACWNKWHQDSSDAIKKKFAAKNSPSISPEKTGSPGPDSDHYTVNGITPMEYVKAMGQNEYRGACILNIIKYVSRYPYKGTPMKDLQKAKWYVEQLIVAQEEIEAAEK